MSGRKRLEAMEREGSLHFFGNSEPVCPHCGAECDVSAHDLYHLHEEGEHEVDCPYCELEFKVSTRIRFSFSTDTQGD